MNTRHSGPPPRRKQGSPLTAELEQVDASRTDLRLLKDLWPFLLPHKRFLHLSLFTIVLGSGITLIRPLVMKEAIDRSVASASPKTMLVGGAIYALISVLEQLISFAQIYAVQILGARSMSDLREHIFHFLGKLPLKFFDGQPVGRVVTRVTNDVDAVQELFNSGALSAVGDLISLVGIVAIMFSLDVELSLAAFCALPFIALLLYFVRTRARDAFRSIRGETARMNANMSEQLSGMALIQAYGQESNKAREFDEINASYRDANMRSIKYDAIQDAAIDAVSAISMASLIAALGNKAQSFGTLVALSAYLTQFFLPISMLAQRYTLLQSALAGAERVVGLLRYEDRDCPARALPETSAMPGAPDAMVELRNITFGYKPGHPVLKNLDLQAKRGEVVALVGPTGSGKTTILSVLLRLYEAEAGEIFVGGREARTLSKDELRRNFAVVPQEVFLFEGTLAENVAAQPQPDLSRVSSVLEQMGALSWAQSREGGLEAKVAPGGANFSAGERQLIAFARALYKDAPVLILDEATANVDSVTEAQLQDALKVLLRGRTSLVVAHRLSTIRAANRIVVLQHGRVTESGTHEELLAQGGLYSTLHRLQHAGETG